MGLFILILIVSVVVWRVVKYFIDKKSQDNRQNSMWNLEDALKDEGFVVSKQVVDSKSKYSLLVDELGKKFALIDVNQGEYYVYNFSDLIDYNILEDGNSIISGTSGGALVGGLLFGGVGAVVGASGQRKTSKTCSSMSVVITVNDLSNPQLNISLITKEIETSCEEYEIAMDTASKFQSVLAVVKSRADKAD